MTEALYVVAVALSVGIGIFIGYAIIGPLLDRRR